MQGQAILEVLFPAQIFYGLFWERSPMVTYFSRKRIDLFFPKVTPALRSMP